MREALLLIAAAVTSYLGFGWLALCQRPHWRAATGGRPGDDPSPGARRRGRCLGALALIAALVLSLAAQGPSFGALLLAAAAVAVTLTLSWRPRWLRPLQLTLPPKPPRQ